MKHNISDEFRKTSTTFPNWSIASRNPRIREKFIISFRFSWCSWILTIVCWTSFKLQNLKLSSSVFVSRARKFESTLLNPVGGVGVVGRIWLEAMAGSCYYEILLAYRTCRRVVIMNSAGWWNIIEFCRAPCSSLGLQKTSGGGVKLWRSQCVGSLSVCKAAFVVRLSRGCCWTFSSLHYVNNIWITNAWLIYQIIKADQLVCLTKALAAMLPQKRDFWRISTDNENHDLDLIASQFQAPLLWSDGVDIMDPTPSQTVCFGMVSVYSCILELANAVFAPFFYETDPWCQYIYIFCGSSDADNVHRSTKSRLRSLKNLFKTPRLQAQRLRKMILPIFTSVL